MAWAFRQWVDHLPLWAVGLMAAVYLCVKLYLVHRDKNSEEEE